ncbi:galactokinase [Geobacter sp. DSM 9736]|uniref:galactokinase n=1 Tax=Geobacter sp. DSM 9736 TaxID=1277350 RepID=UPI000B50F9DF|nr:galactokinase [Geobacter sp. DSM 9736]SNB47506.1 galactokinase [Geobacter sp. DSM 9736]
MTSANFSEIFGFPPETSAAAPGRVNLLGEHTDYNDGFVLPTAIPRFTRIELAHSLDHLNHFHAAELGETVSCGIEGMVPEGFARYLVGCLRVLKEENFRVAPVSAMVMSDVPMGAGLSSSAALEVAMLRALRLLFHLDLDDVRVARLAQRAEIRFAGVNCGIMDQMASSLADAEHMLFLDTRSLERRLLPIPQGAELLVADSGVPRTLAGSKYNERRTECEEAARFLKVPALRDVSDPGTLSILPPLLQRRARHVVTENARVLEAARGVDTRRFGEMMNESHASLRDDFEVSIPPLDLLVRLLQKHPATFGARLTGAGFGGACVALVKNGCAQTVAEEALAGYHQRGGEGRLLVP